ncbi:hypothetical protein [Paraliomyxa miuraensis]|uniref:hypothetical protein n=1 Tax=Paraliomyxa miuraensis TaxID=376150 RepID=UPI00224D101F|nr:hypothetical protein [Paraliomyxa miuraensis]MCX4245871.1 hypothetical protein [Paraliomyxa miuraensis]
MRRHIGWTTIVILGGVLAGCPGSSTDGTGGQGEEGGNDTTGTTTFGPGPGMEVTSSPMEGTGSGDQGVTSNVDDDTAGSFLLPPDGGVVGQCDPYLQDCPKGEKCTSYVATPGQETVDATKCVPIIGDDLWGEACERFEDNDTCAPGYFCMTDVSGHTGMGTCLEYCSVEVPCENGGECFPFNDGVLPVCEVLCDPILQDCPAGQGCYAAFDNFVCAMPGAPAGQGGDGDPCYTIQSCDPGLICRGGTAGCPMDGACCTPVCELSGPPDQCTDPAEDCVPALDDPPPGLQDVGYCGVPA